MLIFDASTLILLAKTELLDEFLDSFAGEVLIPTQVEGECCGAKKSLDALVMEKAINEKRITETRLFLLSARPARSFHGKMNRARRTESVLFSSP